MRLKYKFETVDMGDEIVCVPVGNDAGQFQGILKLNNSAREIVEMLNEDISEQQIVEKLSAKYDTDSAELKKYVSKVVETLRANDLLVG